MGGTGSKQNQNQLTSINRKVHSLRASIRSSQKIKSSSRDKLLAELIKQSTDVTNLKGKVKQKKVDDSLRLISTATNELLSRNSDQNLDQEASIETESFVQVPVSNGKFDLRTKNKSQNVVGQSQQPTLNEIADKLKALKPNITTAIQNQDNKQLRFYKSTIKILATDLELIETQSGTQLDDRKSKLESQLSAAYQKIDKAFREFNRNSNLIYLQSLESKRKTWSKLEIIEQDLQALQNQIQTSKHNEAMLRKCRDSLEKFEPLINSLEVTDEEVRLKKVQLLQRTQQIAKQLVIKSAADESDGKNKVQDSGTNLRELKAFIEKQSTSQSDILKLKTDLLDFIDSSLENPPSTEPGVVMRKKKSLSREKLDCINNFTKELETLPPQNEFSKEELARLDSLLENLQQTVSEKRKSIGNMIQQESLIKTTVKLTETPVLLKVTPNDSDYLKVASELRNLKLKFDFIKEKLSTYQGNKGEIQTKINLYKDRLTELSKHPHPNISSSATSILEEISEIQRASIRLSQNKRNSVEHYLTRITEISSFVEHLAEKNSPSDEVKIALIQSRDQLNEIEIPVQYAMIQQSKNETLLLINNLLQSTLEKKFKSDLAKLKEKVNRFTGGYKNVLYTQIEFQLNKIMIEVSLQIDNKELAEAMYRDGEMHLKILEEKSTKSEQISEIAPILEKSEQELKAIHAEVLTFVGLETSDAYFKLDSEIIKLSLELEKLNKMNLDESMRQKRLKLLSDLNWCGDALDERAAETKQIFGIEKELYDVGCLFDQFESGISQDSKEDLDEQLIALQCRLGKMEVNASLQERKNVCVKRVGSFMKKLNGFSVVADDLFLDKDGTYV